MASDPVPAAGEPAALAPPAPVVTVGIPAYDNAATVARAIRSVQAQTFGRWRLIVSDDASGDETFAICERIAARDPRIRVVRQPKNLLYMNFGYLLRQADTPYFAWLAGDDLWHPTFLEACLAALDAHPEAVSALPETAFVDGTAIAERSPDSGTIDGRWPARAAAFLARPGGTRMYGLFRTEALRRAFPSRNMYAYDFALTLGALRRGGQVAVDRTLITRTLTPWQDYARSVRRLYRSRVLRALPLLDMTVYVLSRHLVPFRPSVLGRLARLNAEKHEEYVFVNLPAAYARLQPVYRALSLPIALRAGTGIEVARRLLRADAPALHARGLRLLEARAAEGDAGADLVLGRYWREEGEPVGSQQAIRHFERAAGGGCADAGFELVRAEIEAGRIAADARGGMYLQAAAGGSPRAAADLARLICAGNAGSVDFAAARGVLEAARDAGQPVVLRALGLLAERGLGRPRDRQAAMALYLAAAPADPRAAREVGRLVLEDAGPGALEEAIHWYRRAAETGDPWALRDLAGLLAERGDRSEALEICLRAAGSGTDPDLNRSIAALMATVSSGSGPVEDRARTRRRAVAAAPGADGPAVGEALATTPVRDFAREAREMRDLVVWGIHRSGTSVLTQGLEAMGWRLGRANRAATVENPGGFFENQALVDIDRRLLAAAGASWSNWAVDFASVCFDAARYDPFRRAARALLDALDAESGDAAWAVKDPRMASLAGFWLPLLRERSAPPRHLLVLRDPREVAASQVTRALHDPAAHRLLHRPEAMLVLWSSHTCNLLRELRHEELLVVPQADLVGDAAAAFARVAAFAGASREPGDAAAGAVQSRYLRSRPEQAPGEGAWAEMAGRLFRRLAERAWTPLRPDDTAEILRASDEVGQAMGYLRPFAGLLAAVERGEEDWFAHDGA